LVGTALIAATVAVLVEDPVEVISAMGSRSEMDIWDSVSWLNMLLVVIFK
jgi:hypothetical protein